MDHYIGEFSIFYDRKSHLFAWLQHIRFVEFETRIDASPFVAYFFWRHTSGCILLEYAFLDIMIKCYEVIPCGSLAAIKWYLSPI